MSELRTHAYRPACEVGITKVVLAAGDVSAPVYTPSSCGVWTNPGVGGTMLVEATGSLPADVRAGTATWHPWDQGTAGVVSSRAAQLLLHATAVRFTATTVAGVGEVSV